MSRAPHYPCYCSKNRSYCQNPFHSLHISVTIDRRSEEIGDAVNPFPEQHPPTNSFSHLIYFFITKVVRDHNKSTNNEDTYKAKTPLRFSDSTSGTNLYGFVSSWQRDTKSMHRLTNSPVATVASSPLPFTPAFSLSPALCYLEITGNATAWPVHSLSILLMTSSPYKQLVSIFVLYS